MIFMKTSTTDVDCGPLKQVDNGRMELLDSRTTYNASGRYVCNENYTLAGSVQRTCSAKGTWEPAEPKCLCNVSFYYFHHVNTLTKFNIYWVNLKANLIKLYIVG